MAITLVALAISACGGAAPPSETTAVAHEEPAIEPDCEGEPICWFHDDYPAARAFAQGEQLPLVVDIWAPWCHTCLAMKHEVLTDPGMEPLAARFVWLAIDTDMEQNAAALEKLPVSSWPTFYVVSPADESIQARYVGAASIEQFREFLAAGEAGHLDAIAGEGELTADDPRYLLREAERAVASGDLDRADELYGAALDAAPADWPRRADVLTSRIAARAKREDWKSCAELGLARMAETGRSASAGDFCFWAVHCAGELGAGDLLREQIHMRALERLAVLADDETAPLTADDRSEVLRLLREVQHRAGDLEAAVRTAERQRILLDEAAAAAPFPEAASTYNWPRAEVYVYLKRGADIIPALEQSAADLPSDYDPPYRVAWVALQIGDLDRALGAAEKALELVYGPRRGRVLSLIADIHGARGEGDAERELREQVLAHYESLPPGQRSERAIEAARRALEASVTDPE
jgi:thioredoxin-like negative regulator of GroEL